MANTTGSTINDTLTGGDDDDVIVGLNGDDTVEGDKGADVLVGDFEEGNLLDGTEDNLTFQQFGNDGWIVLDIGGGHSSMSQNLQTTAGSKYTVTFDAAANIGQGHPNASVEVVWNGTVVATIDADNGIFESHSFELTGTGGSDEIMFRTVEPVNPPSGPTIHTDQPIYYYETDMDIQGQTVTVKAVAEGQPNMYQILDGTLHVFDVANESYIKAGSDGTVTVNGLGFNQEDNLFYGTAVSNGVDSLGNSVSNGDLVMLDANGDSFLIGDTPYRAWTGDFDSSGNLWSFQSSMDRIAVIDVDQKDGNGDPITTVFKFPKDMITEKVWDVAFNAATQKFYGVVKPATEGGVAKLMIIDTTPVASGGEPQFSFIDVTQTLINGSMETGVPFVTFGASIIDSSGQLYVGGNGGDHDMDDATASSGGIYKVVFDEVAGTAHLELVTAAPKSYSNDGAADPRALDPFADTEGGGQVLIRTPEIVLESDVNETYDDMIDGGAGTDTAYGGFGDDTVVGDGLGDTLNGGDGNDGIYGGLAPGSTSSIISFYDEFGNRFDQFGNPLPEDDDVLYGGEGDDYMSGSAGHDVLSGDAGADDIHGGTGNDTLYGGAEGDTLSGGREDDLVYGGDGVDDIQGGTGDDVLHGDAGNDSIRGGSNNDVIDGGTGDDWIDGGSGDDSIIGGSGEDYIKAGSGNDNISAGDGNDYINAGSGDDTIDGGAGRDKILMGKGDDVVTGGDGSDLFVFRSGDDEGGTDSITDYTRDGSENDRIDLRAFNLLDGTTEAAWIAANVSQAPDNSVTININGHTLTLEDHEGLGASFVDTVTDGILF